MSPTSCGVATLSVLRSQACQICGGGFDIPQYGCFHWDSWSSWRYRPWEWSCLIGQHGDRHLAVGRGIRGTVCCGLGVWPEGPRTVFLGTVGTDRLRLSGGGGYVPLPSTINGFNWSVSLTGFSVTARRGTLRLTNREGRIGLVLAFLWVDRSILPLALVWTSLPSVFWRLFRSLSEDDLWSAFPRLWGTPVTALSSPSVTGSRGRDFSSLRRALRLNILLSLWSPQVPASKSGRDGNLGRSGSVGALDLPISARLLGWAAAFEARCHLADQRAGPVRSRRASLSWRVEGGLSTTSWGLENLVPSAFGWWSPPLLAILSMDASSSGWNEASVRRRSSSWRGLYGPDILLGGIISEFSGEQDQDGEWKSPFMCLGDTIGEKLNLDDESASTMGLSFLCGYEMPLFRNKDSCTNIDEQSIFVQQRPTFRWLRSWLVIIWWDFARSQRDKGGETDMR